MNQNDILFQCPDGSAQGNISEGIPLPMFWKPEVFKKYEQALATFVDRYQNQHPNVNYFCFSIGIEAESYPGNGATTSTNYCMETFVNQFEGNTYKEKAINAYHEWSEYTAEKIEAF